MQNLLFQYIKQFITISDDDFQNFIKYFEVRSFKKKDFALKEGEYCLFEGFVIDGCFKVYFLNEQGNEQILYFAIKDWWITDLDSLINNVPCSLSIEALEDSTILFISKKNKEYLYNTMPQIEKLFRIMNQKSSASLQRRILSLMNKTADKRYLEFLDKYPTLEQRLNQQQVASYLGISHEFLSKIRKKINLGKN